YPLSLHYALPIFLGTIAFVASAILLVILVIDKIFNNNPVFHSILTKKKMIEDSGLRLYGFDAYSPEIWFKYGKIIPEVRPENPETYPKEKEFYMISSDNESVNSI